MNKYNCTDGTADITITASSAEEAAQEYVDGGDWGSDLETSWIEVRVTPLKDAPSEDAPAGLDVLSDYGLERQPDGSLTGHVPPSDTADIPALKDECAANPTLVESISFGVVDADGYIPLTVVPGEDWPREEIEDEDDSERITISIDPQEPECDDGHTDSHEWQSPYEVVGGLRENPGVYGHGGGVIITEVCPQCGWYRITDTWASHGAVQGMRSVEYRKPDEASLAWVQSLRD